MKWGVATGFSVPPKIGKTKIINLDYGQHLKFRLSIIHCMSFTSNFEMGALHSHAYVARNQHLKFVFSRRMHLKLGLWPTPTFHIAVGEQGDAMRLQN